MNFELPNLVYTGVGIAATLLAKYLFVSKKDQRSFEGQFTEKLMTRVAQLEGSLETQNQMILKAMQALALAEQENKVLRERINVLEKKLKQYENGNHS